MDSSEERRGSNQQQSPEEPKGKDSRSGSQDSASIAKASELIKTIKTSNKGKNSKSQIVDEIPAEQDAPEEQEEDHKVIVLAEILKLKQGDDDEHLFLARWAGQTEEEATWESLPVFAGTAPTSHGFMVDQFDENGSNVIEVLKAYVNNLSMQEKDNSGDGENSSQKVDKNEQSGGEAKRNKSGQNDSGNQSAPAGSQIADEEKGAAAQAGAPPAKAKEPKRNSRGKKAAPKARQAKATKIKSEPAEGQPEEEKEAAPTEQVGEEAPAAAKPNKRGRAAKQATKKAEGTGENEQEQPNRTSLEDEGLSESGTSGTGSGTLSETLSETLSDSETLSGSDAEEDTYDEDDGTSASGTESEGSETEGSGSSEEYTEGYSDEATDFTEGESDSEEEYIRQSKRLRKRRFLNKMRHRRYEDSETTYEATSSTEDDSLNWRARSRHRSKDRYYPDYGFHQKIARGSIRPFKKRYEDLEVELGIEGKLHKHDVKKIVSLVVVNGTMFFEVTWHRDRKGNKPRKSLIQDKLFAQEYPDMVIDFLNKGRMLGSYY